MEKSAKFPYHVRVKTIIHADSVVAPKVAEYINLKENCSMEQAEVLVSLLRYLDKKCVFDHYCIAEVYNSRNEVSYAASAPTSEEARKLLFRIIPSRMVSMIGKN